MEFIWTNSVIQIIAFLILYWVLQKFAFGPLFRIMDKRKEHIHNEVSAAEKAHERANEAVKKQKEELEKARNEAYQIIENAKKQADSQGDKILANAKEQAERTLEEARAEIEREREKAVASLREQTAELSVMLASKIIEKELDADEQAKEVDRILEQVDDRI
ncbi:MAG TPA: F0F1 ATP synthase subunit B [Bacillales bacterium]|nr:F0F1 ATP synthase subunit B [Bacillales bacterium]